jgi:hypothetical protein
MIYEVRTYRLKPRSVQKFIQVFGEAYEKRREISPLAAFFSTEVGPLNEVIHIWPYESPAERERIRIETENLDFWPPKVGEFIVDMACEVFVPFPFAGEFGSGKLGPLFEWREYTLNIGRMSDLINWWEPAIDERRKASPLVMAMQTETGALNKFVHIWGYKNFEERNQVRGDLVKSGIWPPTKFPEGALRVQKNKLCFAAPFSPLQ